MSVVERVARAICCPEGCKWAEAAAEDLDVWAQAAKLGGKCLSTDWHKEARAAIMADRDPAFERLIFERIAHGDEQHREWLRAKLSEIFTERYSAITAALHEPSEGE